MNDVSFDFSVLIIPIMIPSKHHLNSRTFLRACLINLVEKFVVDIAKDSLQTVQQCIIGHSAADPVQTFVQVS